MSLVSTWLAFWTVMYTLSTTLILLRLYLRWQHKRFGRSDYTTIACLVLSTIMYSVAIPSGTIAFTRPGGPYHASGSRAIETAFFFMLSGYILVPLTKVCVTLLLLEVEVADGWRRILHVMQTLILVTGSINLILNFFGCYVTNDKVLWSILARYPSTFADRCIVRTYVIPINGGLNGLYELTIFICSISLVFRVRTTAVQKIGLAFTFGLGLVTMTATVMTTYITLSNYLRQLHGESPDILAGEYAASGLWFATEAYVGLVVGSLLPIRKTILHGIHTLLKACGIHTERSESSTGTSTSRMTVTADDEEKMHMHDRPDDDESVEMHVTQQRIELSDAKP